MTTVKTKDGFIANMIDDHWKLVKINKEDGKGWKVVKRNHRPHWYKWISDGCVVCGGKWRRERVYGIKPSDVSLRYEDRTGANTYCGCLERIMPYKH